MSLARYNITSLPFWDVKYETLDIEKDKTFIIGKVMNYGGLSDFKAVVKYYGKETIRIEVIKIAYYPKEILSFLCFYFDLKKEDFTCYNRRQLMPQHWI